MLKLLLMKLGKAGPGKDKDVHAIVDDLHKQVAIRIDVIRHIETL